MTLLLPDTAVMADRALKWTPRTSHEFVLLIFLFCLFFLLPNLCCSESQNASDGAEPGEVQAQDQREGVEGCGQEERGGAGKPPDAAAAGAGHGRCAATPAAALRGAAEGAEGGEGRVPSHAEKAEWAEARGNPGQRWVQVQRCFTSTETVRTVRDGEPGTATPTFICTASGLCQRWSSV